VAYVPLSEGCPLGLSSRPQTAMALFSAGTAVTHAECEARLWRAAGSPEELEAALTEAQGEVPCWHPFCTACALCLQSCHLRSG
jgi:hypothetical protein